MEMILKIVWKELWKKKAYTLLLLAVCVIAMNTVVSSITNTTAESYQHKIFERNIGPNLENILHIHYSESTEMEKLADSIPNYLRYIASLDGVKNVGQFERTGIHFTELQNMKSYENINRTLQQGKKYENHPTTADVLYVDESLLSLVKIGITEYTETTSGNLPVIASEAFKEILPVGTILTLDRTGTQYEMTGYLPIGKQWVDQDDLIRFPLESMDGCFIAPFSSEDKTDILTQLSCLHNTYVIISDDADLDFLQIAIEDYSLSHGFHATANSLREEYDVYRQEINKYKIRQIALAVFISIMATSSIVAVFTTNTILKQGKYGIYLANGFTRKDIAIGILIEIVILILPTALFVWLGNLFNLMYSSDVGIVMFRDVLLTAHLEYTLPICIFIAVIVGVAAALLPMIKVCQYQPCELIGGHKNGND